MFDEGGQEISLIQVEKQQTTLHVLSNRHKISFTCLGKNKGNLSSKWGQI